MEHSRQRAGCNGGEFSPLIATPRWLRWRVVASSAAKPWHQCAGWRIVPLLVVGTSGVCARLGGTVTWWPNIVKDQSADLIILSLQFIHSYLVGWGGVSRKFLPLFITILWSTLIGQNMLSYYIQYATSLLWMVHLKKIMSKNTV